MTIKKFTIIITVTLLLSVFFAIASSVQGEEKNSELCGTIPTVYDFNLRFAPIELGMKIYYRFEIDAIDNTGQPTTILQSVEWLNSQGIWELDEITYTNGNQPTDQCFQSAENLGQAVKDYMNDTISPEQCEIIGCDNPSFLVEYMFHVKQFQRSQVDFTFIPMVTK